MPDDPDEASIIQAMTQADAEPPPWLVVGPGDDAAVFSDGGVVTVDAMLEGVHFDTRHRPEQLGARLVAVNASDLAACGARPRWALLTLSLPSPTDAAWVKAFSAGLRAALDAVGATLVGGDTTSSKAGIVLTLTLYGQLAGPALLRSGGRPGDTLWVSGTLGDASAGFSLDQAPEALLLALTSPRPPLALGPALAEAALASAAMDLSDGLHQDLLRLCAASGCGAEVSPEALPCSDALRAATADPLPHQVAFGDDYQLLFSAPAHHRAPIRALGDRLDLRLTEIGHLTADPAVTLRGRPWPSPRWRHFGGAA